MILQNHCALLFLTFLDPVPNFTRTIFSEATTVLCAAQSVGCPYLRTVVTCQVIQLRTLESLSSPPSSPVDQHILLSSKYIPNLITSHHCCHHHLCPSRLYLDSCGFCKYCHKLSDLKQHIFILLNF